MDNNNLDENWHGEWFLYGAEGGYLHEAHLLNLRVLADQRGTTRNLAMLRSIVHNTQVRLVVNMLRDDGTARYVFCGYFVVIARFQVWSNGFRVYEFLLRRALF
ncbi:hypothetical protein TSUD_45010 [Trifolium subterraneum]|nr:hypothetical protein TSUD_45010 [Trifolium subterraneum]